MESFRMLPHAADWAAAVSGPGADAQHLPPAANAQGQMAADSLAVTRLAAVRREGAGDGSSRLG